LRDALKAVVGSQQTTYSQQPTINTKPEPKKGPSPEELKKILDVQ